MMGHGFFFVTKFFLTAELTVTVKMLQTALLVCKEDKIRYAQRSGAFVESAFEAN